MADASLDPLKLLREFTLRNQPVIFDRKKDDLVFGDLRFPRKTQTYYRSQRGTGAPYSLDAVWFILNNRTLSIKEYRTECGKTGFPIISWADKKSLIEYLTGATESCPYIVYDPTVTVSATPAAAPATSDVAADTTREEPAAKRQKVVEEPDDVVMDENLTKSKDMFLEHLHGLREKARHSKSTKGNEESDDITLPSGIDMAFVKANAKQTRQIQERERVIVTRATVLQAKQKTFEGILTLLKDEERFVKEGGRLKPEQRDAHKSRQSSKPSSGEMPQSKRKKTKTPAPIIIVPAGSTSILTLLNAPEFLQDGKFCSVRDKMDQGARKSEKVVINRQKGKQRLPFEIVDDVSKFTEKEWDRVVACFVHGPAWQFKGWKYSQPSMIFTNVKGFFIQYEDEAAHENIAKWDVTVLKISKTKRHLDATVWLSLWESLDRFIQTKKRHLVPPPN
eukprot:GFYU01012075.1.p1 GENE.GFYU01012075.1~~GFYU01012075.1.p1  ORF type:complete len:450 (+),score=103.69 GFYU01012075.1:157-1506(+)